MDVAKIEKLIEVLENSQAEGLSVRKGEVSVSIRKGRPPTACRSAKAQLAAEKLVAEPSADEHYILAPMVGVFHAIDGIAKVGTRISAGQVVGAIESMKLLNDVVSDVSGVVSEVLFEDGTPVEYGQALCKVKLGH